MFKASWEMDFDWRNDKTFVAPMHKKCDAPIVLHDGKYICINCSEEAVLDTKMKAWIDARSGTKVETKKCDKCGKGMGIFYNRNRLTTEWQVAGGECSCGNAFIV